MSLKERAQNEITLDRAKLQKLISHFWEVAGLADEMDIYEWEEGDQALQEAKEWVEENFGR